MFIETETTPHPSSLKFLPGRQVMAMGTREFSSPEAAEASPLAQAIFDTGEVVNVFYGHDFVTVTAAPGVDWSALKPEVTAILLDHFELDESDLYRARGPVNLNRLMMIADTSQRAELKFQPFTPGVPEVLMVAENPFEAIAKKDVLLHHPFQSFAPVIDLLAAAAADPEVLAIKQTLYRTGPQSPVVDHLVAAARAGKEVTVVVELMARFDEAANIALSSRLQEAGAHVIFGVLGYKTHAKMLLIVRREGDALKRYVHLGTGNYHPKTTRLYTDYGLLTAADDVGQDVHNLFMRLSSLTNVGGNRKLLSSPFELHTQLLKYIRRERRNALAGKPARIVAKINSLIEPRIISALYAASNAGVQIDLIVRGICILRPGVP